jgi:arylsulfatase A-like enzyme
MCCVLLGAWLALRARRIPAPVPELQSTEDTLLLSFDAAAVDGVDVLVLRGREAWVEHQRWKPIKDLSLRLNDVLPAGGGQRVYVQDQLGRAGVEVIQQPGPENGYETKVRIDDDAPRGAAPLHFALVATANRSVPAPRNVLIVTIDSLRADRLGSYGYARPTSPHLDAFAAGSVRFENAFSTSSFTPPSHASLLTSRYVGDHGLLTWNQLPAEQLTLPELLSRYGYRTGASVNLGLLSAQGLGQGVAWRREGSRKGSKIVGDALDFIRHPDDRPWFLWIHLYDVHRPYKRLSDRTRRFAQHDRSEVGDTKEDYNLGPEAVRERGLGEEDLRYIADRYDDGVAFTDALLAPLLAEVSTPARQADTLVVVTADHGESLLDHPEQLFTHDPFLFSAVTRIPLLIRYPGGRDAGAVREELVSLIDVAPTVTEVVGLGAPPVFEGLSLAGLGAGTPFPRDAIFHETWGKVELKAVRTREWLLVRDVKGGSTSAFDLVADVGERHPMPTDSGAGPTSLAGQLDARVRGTAGTRAPVLGDDLVEQLHALGYAGE